MTLKCSTLILDLDGTISDPSLGISRCFNHSLDFHGFDSIPEDQIAGEIGPPLDQMFLKLVPQLKPEDTSKLVSTYRERYAELGYAENRLYPEIPATLQKLSDLKIRMGVCTSKRRDFAIKILTKFGLLELFKFVDGGDVGISKGEQLANLLSTREIDGQAIMVGDRAVDIVAAQQNSLRSIGVLWGFGSQEELAGASPNLIIGKVTELTETIAQPVCE